MKMRKLEAMKRTGRMASTEKAGGSGGDVAGSIGRLFTTEDLTAIERKIAMRLTALGVPHQ